MIVEIPHPIDKNTVIRIDLEKNKSWYVGGDYVTERCLTLQCWRKVHDSYGKRFPEELLGDPDLRMDVGL